MEKNIKRGDIWHVDFEPVEGHEQGGARPAVIMSSDQVNCQVTELVFVIPGTRSARTDPTTGEVLPDVLRVEPSKENGLSAVTYFLCNQLRAVSTNRLGAKKMGKLTGKQLYQIEDCLIFLLDLEAKDF